MDNKDNIIDYLNEEIESVHMYLDTLNIPIADQEGENYSIVERIKLLQESYVIKEFDFKIQNIEDSINDFNSEIIEQTKPIFNAYPHLTKLPVFAWGRYYKYECAGEPFEYFVDDHGFLYFNRMLKDSQNIQWDLLEEIDKTHNVQGGKLWIGEWDVYIDRERAVKMYDFDDRGGMSLIVVKDGDNYHVECVDCDSPE